MWSSNSDLIHTFYFLDLFKESVLTSFDNEWDVMPRGRVKVVHSIGGVCRFTLNIQNSIYSGLLKNGERTGIIRMGSARDVSASAGVKPGVALKFLRTGRLSANFFVMNTLNSIPNQNYNFFSYFTPRHRANCSNLKFGNRKKPGKHWDCHENALIKKLGGTISSRQDTTWGTLPSYMTGP